MRWLYQFSCMFLCIGIAFQMSLAAEQPVCTFENIQNQIQVSANQVQCVIDQILSTPPDQQTFENTLGAWDEIIKQIQMTDALLNDQMKSDFPEKAFARESIQEYQSFIHAICLNHAEFYYPLFSYAKKAVMENSLKTPVQRQVANLFGINCEQFKKDMSREDQEILAMLIKLNVKVGAPHRFRLSPDRTRLTEEDGVILCGDVSVSARGDSQGNASAEVSVSEKSSDGTLSGTASVEVSRDSQGNVTTSGELRGTYHFNN